MDGGGGKARGEDERQEEDPAQQLGKQALDMLSLPPLMTHVALVLVAGWIASRLELNLLFVFTLGFAYLCSVESRQRQKIEIRIRNDERKSTDRKRLLSDAETARWLNNVVESLWPIFLEKFASEFLLRLAPWFLEKYKPWTAKNVVLQRLYLGKSPPVFTFFRAGRHPSDGDHVVVEMTMNLSAARDMHASMAVQMRKRLGLGIWTSFQISNIQVEGKVKVGVRFKRGWPVIERLRICFSEAPVIRMVAKPMINYGIDVTDLPGIAAWLDKMIIEALEQCLVEPNMLVVDVEKLVGDVMSVNAAKKLQTAKSSGSDGSGTGDWFFVGQSGDVATLLVEILEADQLKPCDPNGKADPYVKIVLGKAEFLTSIKRKTLEPSWHEQFRIPISNWAVQNSLVLRVRDKDRFVDDEMGEKQIKIDDVKDGERHDMWLHLDGVKTGRLRVALTVEKVPVVDEKENISLNRSQSEDARKDSVRSPVSEYPREASDRAGGSGSSGEAYGTADPALIPLKDESQAVDVGLGPAGAVAIVNPGRHVVKEAYSTERLRQRNKSRKESAETDRESVEREKRPEVSSGREEQLDYVQLDLNSGGHTARKSRVAGLVGPPESQAQSGELMHDSSEMVVLGSRGSEVHTKLLLDEDGKGNLGEQQQSDEDELPPVPQFGEFAGANLDPSERHFRHMLGRSSMKRMGKGVIKQAGKTAHNIGYVFKKFGRSDSDRALTTDLPLNYSAGPRQDETHTSDKAILAGEQGPEDRPSFHSEVESLDRWGRGPSHEGQTLGDSQKDDFTEDNQETSPRGATQSLVDNGLKQDDLHNSNKASLVEEPHERAGSLPQAVIGSVDHFGQDVGRESDIVEQTGRDESKTDSQETPPGVASRLTAHNESVDEEDHQERPPSHDAVKEESFEPEAPFPEHRDVNASEGDDDDGLQKSVDVDRGNKQSVELNSPQRLQNLPEYYGDTLLTPSSKSKPPTRDPPPLPTSPRPEEIPGQ